MSVEYRESFYKPEIDKLVNSKNSLVSNLQLNSF